MLLLLSACFSPPVSAKNVVLVVGCTVRQDQVTPYGGEPGVTPFLEQMAAEGVLIRDPIAAAPWTRAAGTALFTGHHAISLGMIEPGPGLNQRRLPAAAKTAAERFQEAGYRTYGGTSNPNLNRVYGFAQGFETYTEPARIWMEDRTKWEAGSFVPSVVNTVPVASEQPTFITITLVDAHAPFHGAGQNWQAWKGDVPDEVARYRFALNGLDRGIERLFGGLEVKGYNPTNTLFVVVSDHGEGLSWPTHHGRSHGRYLYGTASQMIWLMRGPKLPEPPPGVVSQLDVLPTLLAWAGIEHDLPGVALGAAKPGRMVFSDTWFRQESRLASWTDGEVCMKDFAPGTVAPTGAFVEGCYDRMKDGLQANPLPLKPAPLDAWRAAHPVLAGEISDDQALHDQLRVLGYLDE